MSNEMKIYIGTFAFWSLVGIIEGAITGRWYLLAAEVIYFWGLGMGKKFWS